MASWLCPPGKEPWVAWGRGRAGSAQPGRFLVPGAAGTEGAPHAARLPGRWPLCEGSPQLPSLFFFFFFKQIQKHPVWGLGDRRAPEKLCPRSGWMEGSTPHRMGPGRYRGEGCRRLRAPSGGGRAGPSAWETRRARAPQPLGIWGPGARRPRPHLPALCFRTGSVFLFLCFSPWPGRLSSAQSRGDFQETVVVKNPNRCRPAASSHMGRGAATWTGGTRPGSGQRPLPSPHTPCWRRPGGGGKAPR